MAGIDLGAILEAANNTSGVIGQASTAQIGMRNAQADLQNTSADLQLDIGANNAIIEQVKNQGALASQNARLKAGAIFGADLNQQGEQITQNVDLWNGAYQQKLKSLKDIQEKDSVGFMDNPLGFIINQFSVNDDIRSHNSALEIEQAAKQHIDEINQMSNATAQNQKNFEISINQAAIDASAKNTADTAQVAANKAKTDGLNYNIEGLQTAINASKEQTALKFQSLSAANAQAQLGLAMQNYALHKQEFDWKKEEKAKAAEGDDFFVDRIQAGLKVMYGDKAPDLSASPKLARQYLMLLKSNSPAGKEATDAYMAGQSGVLGGSPAQVIDSIGNGVAFQFTPAQAPIKKLFDLVTQEVSQGVASGAVTKANYQSTINNTVTGKLNTYLKDIEPGSGNNPFNIGAVSSIIQMPGVSNLPLAKNILAPAVISGAKLDDPKQVYSTAISAINSGKLSIADAADGLVTLYQKGVDTNLATRQLTKFGIVPTENMHSYKTQIEVDPTSAFGGTEIVDMTNANAVKRAIMKTMATNFADRHSSGIFGAR
jgi:hypothetical protein